MSFLRKKFRLGLDIGIASVGWAIVDEDENIIDAGVRLFPEAGSKATAERRVKRSSRRLLRRRAHRVERVRELLFNSKIIDSKDYDFYTNDTTPYELRVKGLKNRLTERELAIVLLNLVKKRGIHNFEIKGTGNEEEKGTKSILANNEKRLEGKFVCEVQLERLNLGLENVDVDNGSVRGKRNVFRTEDYVAEINEIFKIQKEFNPKITEEFVDKYIKILEGRREYYTGPGDPSPYGWEDEEEWIEGLFGRCTYFPEEIRMCKKSYTAELFNLLNDLNNLTIRRAENNKLTKEEKEKLIELSKKENLTLKRIANTINVKEVDISGYKTDEKHKPKFTSLGVYRDINKIFGITDWETIDEIARILTIYQTNDKIISNIEKLGISVTDEIKEKLDKLPTYTGSHSLSKKAMMTIMDDLLETSKNQMELFTEAGITSCKMDFTGKTTIPKDYVDEWISSPVAKRSLTQTINVINAVHKKYGTPEEIVIEMAREKNSDDKKEIIAKIQKKNAETNKKVKELLDGRTFAKNSGIYEKLKLWDEQDGVCPYSGKVIKIEEILNRPELFEIDHIIPRSISFDDSQNNKVLVLKDENQNKKNMTPYQYLSSTGRYDEYRNRINATKLNKRKKENLLFEGELSKYTRKFIARNLVDTRHITREILNLLKKYYKDNQKHVKIKSVTGAMTNQVRKMWRFKKDRELSYSHHAQDALIMLTSEKIIRNLRNVRDFIENEDISDNSLVNMKTGEILSDDEYRRLFKQEYGDKIKAYNRYRYSHYVDKKPNRQLSDETIYSTRIVNKTEIEGKKGIKEESEYIISKQSDIYGKNNKNIKKFFEDEKKQKQLLMYHNDPKTFEKFMRVYEEYKKETNPFFAYYNEHKKYITKYAKKDDGPPVLTIKYRVSELGNYLDITHKYNVEDKKVVMLSIKSLRADVYKKGNSYKFVTVTYLMMEDKGRYYQLDEKEYEKFKEIKGIDNSYEFVFSLYSGDIIEVGDEKIRYKFKGVNSDKLNRFEIDFIDKLNTSYIKAIKELQEKLKNDEHVDSYMFANLIEERIGLRLSPSDCKEFIKKYSVSSGQKILTIGKDIKYLNKKYIDTLGVEYDSKERFISRIYKK